jgi:hypothetical protein
MFLAVSTVVALASLLGGCPLSVRQQPVCVSAADSVARWRLTAGLDAGRPQGWVQVRENTIAGTRLRVGPDLSVRRLRTYSLGIDRRLGARTWLDVTVAGTSLEGTVTLDHDIMFNGATLERGTTLRTAVGLPRFVGVTAVLDRRLFAIGLGSVSVRGGLTFEALTFVLRGTLAPSSAMHETREDFVTQELPAPVAGVSAQVPVARHLWLVAELDASYLPRVNSLRREGGEVTLQQNSAGLTAGLRYDVGRAASVAVAYHAMSFAQRENSTEDGNDIVLRASAIAIRLTVQP